MKMFIYESSNELFVNNNCVSQMFLHMKWRVFKFQFTNLLVNESQFDGCKIAIFQIYITIELANRNFSSCLHVCLNLAKSAFKCYTIKELEGNNIFDAMLTETTLVETTLVETTLVETTLVETTLVETTLVETTLVETTLVETTLVETTLVETTLVETTLVETTLVEQKTIC